MELDEDEETTVIYTEKVREGLIEFFEINGYPEPVALTAMNTLIINTYFERFPLEVALGFADLFKKQIIERYNESS